MSDISYERLRRRVSEDLNAHTKEFGKIVEDVDRYFRYLGLGTAVWHPEKVHGTNLGGLDAESYVGYSRIEGKWGLVIRTIERDHETHAFVSQRVYTIGSSGNMELVANALRKIPELVQLLEKTVDQQIRTVAESSGEFEALRKAERES
jgi:hypothetical protein